MKYSFAIMALAASTEAMKVEQKHPAPYGLAWDGFTQGPAYPSPQPFVRGEKQWMDNSQNINDWSDYHTWKANVRIPYWSTFVQTSDDVDDEAVLDSVHLENLSQRDAPEGNNEAEKIATPTLVPIDYHLVQTIPVSHSI